jgi:hypothetical protein
MEPIDRNFIVVRALFAMLMASCAILGQSTNQDYPTPLTSNEIAGTIKARDIGDARITSYFYQFEGNQGDLFINIVTRNFTGDIDVFTMNGLRPVTKIVVYADFAESETGRVIYLRKPEKMILRVQGRSPGDDPATFRIKFAGSFVASTQPAPAAEPELPILTAKNESGIRVNSVGTIVEIIPKATPTPTPVETATGVTDERTDAEESEKAKDAEKAKQDVAEAKSEEKSPDPNAGPPEKKMEVVVTDNLPEKTETILPRASTRRPARNRGRTPPKTPPADTAALPLETTSRTSPPAGTRRGRTPPKVTVPKEPDPLEKINLVILFKDGTTIERPLSEVLRFTVDKGILTVIAKDGSIGRYSMLDVAKVTIE